MKREVILLIGANGQIGTALRPLLQETYGLTGVVSSDIRTPEEEIGPFEKLDATDVDALTALIKRHRVTQIYHLAAVLSAKGEIDPIWTWNLNMQTLLNVLEVARMQKLHKVFFPSSIAAFGPTAPAHNTHQYAYLDPTTVYGISKVAAENWGHYYHHRYGLDIRSLRYPGVISYQSLPGGGTTDYAIDMYHKAITGHPCICFLREDTQLPMIYMDDALRATIELMNAPADKITIRSSYNLAGMSFTPAELAASIQAHFPAFRPQYQPDFRQAIADSWPKTIDDSIARRDWGWQPLYKLSAMTHQMITNLVERHYTTASSF